MRICQHHAVVFGSFIGACALFPSVRADDHVIISASANPAYTAQKFTDGKFKTETYVVMPGSYYSGATVDHYIDRMPFRQIAGYLAEELAKREYWPSRDPGQADLLLVIDWGTTMPTISTKEMMARTNPNPDIANSRDSLAQASQAESGLSAAGADLLSGLGAEANINADYASEVLMQQTDANEAAANQANTATLLGYTATLGRFKNSLLPSVAESTLRRSLEQERYFVIVQAYDLRQWKKGTANKPVWSIRLNISSPGNNFAMAMSRMSKAGVDFFGRTTSEVTTVRSKSYDGKVKVAPLVILGEVK
jgi:hypothetical protein